MHNIELIRNMVHKKRIKFSFFIPSFFGRAKFLVFMIFFHQDSSLVV
jgi:hypothetical protein